MRAQFPIFTTPVDLAHNFLEKCIFPGDCVVDATCGNGYDTFFLAKRVSKNGKIIALDVQQQAIDATKERLQTLTEEDSPKISYHVICHSKIDTIIPRSSVKAVVYNLGYLPRSDKSITTMTHTTYESILKALDLLIHGGFITVTLYPGHSEGKKEQDFLLERLLVLDQRLWNVSHCTILNRAKSPSLLTIQRAV